MIELAFFGAFLVANAVYCFIKIRQDMAAQRFGIATLGVLGMVGTGVVLACLIYVPVSGVGL
ncbi:MAG TPA: hypothetical protein VGR19_05420 [Allosphingosinicella sp.]|nr:hypothetical protein [Allosphingosinicella sp.]